MASYQKQDLAVVHRFHIDMYLRDLKLNKKNKWKEFKVRRSIIIEKYMIVKRRSMAMSILARQIHLFKCLKATKAAMAINKENRRFKMYCARVALLMYIRLGKPMRKHGGFEYCMENKIRDVISFSTWCMKP